MRPSPFSTVPTPSTFPPRSSVTTPFAALSPALTGAGAGAFAWANAPDVRAVASVNESSERLISRVTRSSLVLGPRTHNRRSVAPRCEAWQAHAVPRFSAVLPLVVAAVLGGAVGGLVVSQLAPRRAEPSVVAEAPVKSATTDAPLETRVLALEEKVARLSRRPPGVALPAPTGAAANDAGTGGPGPVIDDPVFEVAVRDIVDRVEEERSSARDVRRDEQ